VLVCGVVRLWVVFEYEDIPCCEWHIYYITKRFWLRHDDLRRDVQYHLGGDTGDTALLHFAL
jgi:hypothetical protein